MNKYKFFFLSLFIMIICTITVYAQENNTGIDLTSITNKTVKVGFPILGQLTKKDAHGNLSGYTYDYLQEITQYTGWEYEFIEIPGDINESLTTMLEMLSKGEIDIMGGLVKNEYTEKEYDFPEYSYGTSYTTLYALQENTLINESNYQSTKPLRITVYENASNTNSKLEDFCKIKNITYELVACKTEDEMIDALKRDEADVMIGNDSTLINGFRTIAQFNGTEFYFAVSKGNSEILESLNNAILTIKQTNPYFEASLYAKYFSNPTNTVYLTGEEKKYIQSANPLKVVLTDDMVPVQYIDNDGQIKGIIKDILDKISLETGLKFEYIISKNYDDAFQLLRDNEADAICGLPYDYKLAQSHSLIMSNSLLSAQCVLITREGQTDDLMNKSIGVIDTTQAIVNNDNADIKKYNTVFECMDAVKSKEVDGAYMDLYSAEHLSHYTKYKDLRMIPQSENSINLCLGVKKPIDINLISIFNKALLNISPNDLENIIYQNIVSNTEKISLSIFIEQNPFLSIGFISSVFIILTVIGMFILRLKIKASKILDVENKRYMQLCELANEYIYEYDCVKDRLIFSNGFSNLLSLPLRIDNFIEIINGIAELPSSINPEIFEFFKSMIDLDKISDSNDLWLTLNKEQRWYRNTQVAVKDASGKLIYIIGKLTDVQNEKEEKEKLEQQILKDGLTEIYNSIATKNNIGKKLSSLTSPAALIIIDIDKFKDINDTIGHYMGDVVLKDFAKTLTEISGAWDIAGRIGGDEFMLYINHAKSYENISELCNSLCKIARKTYTNDEGISHSITISVGAAIVYRSCEFADLYQAVDKNLYISKNNGRDRYTLNEYKENKSI